MVGRTSGAEQRVASATYNCALGSAPSERRDHPPKCRPCRRADLHIPSDVLLRKSCSEITPQDFQGDATGMKKPSSKIREEIARLQDQLRQAETREAERIGRIALKAGLGEIEIEEAELQAAFEEITGRFRGGKAPSTGRKNAGDGRAGGEPAATIASGAPAGRPGEA